MNWKKLFRWLKPVLKAAAKAAINRAVDEVKLANWLASHSFVRDLLNQGQIERLAEDFKGWLLKTIEGW